MKATLHWSSIMPALAHDLAQQSFDGYCRNQCCQRLYLYGDRDPDKCWRTFRLLDELQSEDTTMEPVTGEPIPWSYTVDRLAAWFRDRLRPAR